MVIGNQLNFQSVHSFIVENDRVITKRLSSIKNYYISIKFYWRIGVKYELMRKGSNVRFMTVKKRICLYGLIVANRYCISTLLEIFKGTVCDNWF